MKVGIINNSKHENPSYKTSGSSGMDIRANINKSIIIHPGERKAIPTGIFLEIPTQFEAQVRPRSGLALNAGVTVLNTPGTIDADYRGEILVILINHSKQSFFRSVFIWLLTAVRWNCLAFFRKESIAHSTHCFFDPLFKLLFVH